MKYILTLEEEDMAVLDAALVNMQYKVVAKLINKINQQVTKQIEEQKTETI